MSSYLFAPLGDRELWVVRADGYQLPVFVQPGIANQKTNAFLVCPAIGLEPDQKRWLEHHLNAIGVHRVGAYWLLNAERAALVLRKAPGVTPKRYVLWGTLRTIDPPVDVNGVTVAPEQDNPSEQKTMSANADDFVRYVAGRIQFTDLHAARILWYEFCRHAPNWMLESGKGLDMYFGVLRAFPYRRNWKAIMAAKFPGFGPIAAINDGERLKQALSATMIGWQMEQPEMTSMTEQGCFDWTVDVELRDIFLEHTRTYERQQLDALGPVPYYKRWLTEVRSRYEGAVSTLRSFWVQSSRPVGDVDQVLPAHRRFLRWFLKVGRVRPDVPDVPEADYCTRSEPPDDNQIGAKAYGRPPPFTVPDVPDKDICLDLRGPRRDG